MSEARTRYVQAREALLLHITQTLKHDERLVAACKPGSYGRDEQKWSSDLDVHVVVANDYSEALCAQPWPSGAKTTPERLALFAFHKAPVKLLRAPWYTSQLLRRLAPVCHVG
jgi:hypothetical protein